MFNLTKTVGGIRGNLKMGRWTKIGLVALCIGGLMYGLSIIPRTKVMKGHAHGLTYGSSIVMNIDIRKNWKQFLCYVPNRSNNLANLVKEEIFKDVKEGLVNGEYDSSKRDLEKVTGYVWLGKFYVTKLEINGETFEFDSDPLVVMGFK